MTSAAAAVTDVLHAVLDVPHEVEDGLGADDEIEGRGQGGARIEVAHPELGASELPLLVSVVLCVGGHRLLSTSLL